MKILRIFLINDFFCTFCADDCNNFMKVSYSSYVDEFGTSSSVQKISYNKCFCNHGLPSLRCPSEDAESCDPDRCFTFYHYNHKKFSCEENECKCNIDGVSEVPNNECLVHDSIKCQAAAPIPTCEETQHYDKITKQCEENVCVCPYGIVKPDSCLKHGAYNCDLEKCEDFASPVYAERDEIGETGVECVKSCQKETILDDNWYKPHNETAVYWLVVDKFDALNDYDGFVEFSDYVLNNQEKQISEIPHDTHWTDRESVGYEYQACRRAQIS